MGSGKHRWKISFHRSPSTTKKPSPPPLPPKEFICPISNSLMSDPVIVSSGHTFERNCINACKSLSFTPTLPDGSTPDFSTVIPNLALKSTILNWAHSSLLDHHPPPKPLDSLSAHKLVETLLSQQTHFKTHHQKHTQFLKDSTENNGLIAVNKLNDSDTELTLKPIQLSSSSNEWVAAIITTEHTKDGVAADKLSDSFTELTLKPIRLNASSEESVAVNTEPSTPLPLKTRPSCYSSSSSSDNIDTLNPNSYLEDEFIPKLRSSHVFEQEEALISLRKLTRTQEPTRIHLCTPHVLSTLRQLITSRYASIQVNSTAALVNLSLENSNKVKIVRSGLVPPLIDVLSGGFPESQDHAAGVLFSLALDDQNKTAIGVLGALPPLLHALRSDSERTRHDSALALYHLSLVQSNRVKLVKFGAVQLLLGMVKSGQVKGRMMDRVMLVVCNLSGSVEGRAAVMDSGGVECFVGMLSRGEFDSESTREGCVASLYGLSQGGLRFKVLAKEAGAEEVLMKEEDEVGTERVKEKVRKILEVMREKDEEEEEVDWAELLNSGEVTQTRFRLGGALDGSSHRC